MSGACWLCNGTGQLDVADQCASCPLCRTHEDLPVLGDPVLHTGGWLGNARHVRAQHYGPPLHSAPDMIVIHRGWRSGDIARYFAAPGDGRQVSAHFVVEDGGEIVQCVPLTHRAWHASAANRRSIGIEHRGPTGGVWPDAMLAASVALVEQLLQIYPGIRSAVAHSRLSTTRRDPGPGYCWGRLVGLGLEVVS
jgi:N-acetyl-anhydromuramyl-L-alanine amidase AmpD